MRDVSRNNDPDNKHLACLVLGDPWNYDCIVGPVPARCGIDANITRKLSLMDSLAPHIGSILPAVNDVEVFVAFFVPIDEQSPVK